MADLWLSHWIARDMLSFKDNIYFSQDWVVCRNKFKFYLLKRSWPRPLCYGVVPMPKEMELCGDHACFNLTLEKSKSQFSKADISEFLPFAQTLCLSGHPACVSYEVKSVPFEAKDWPESLRVFVLNHWKYNI
jgi:hypothetical protein